MGCPDTVSVLALDPSNADTSGLQSPMKTAEAFARAVHSKLLATSIFKPVDLTLRAVGQNFKTSSEIADCLQKVAKDEEASFIIVFTHLRKNPYFAATFTQRLTESGDTPILAINASASAIDQVQRLLVATDLTPSAKASFDGAVELAVETGAELILFHHQMAPMLEAERESVTTIAQSWVDEALKRGVAARAMIITEPRATADLIVKAAEDSASDLIVVGHHERSLHLTPAGKLTTRLLSQSTKPVLIINKEK